jgi:hypothetical protein
MKIPVWEWFVVYRKARLLQRQCRVYLDVGKLPPRWLWAQSQAAYAATKAPFKTAVITLLVAWIALMMVVLVLW